MLLFLELLGFLALFSLIALVKASRNACNGFEDDAGFHCSVEAPDAMSTSGPKMLDASSPERTERGEAA
jgi:hypothetical protein